MGVKLPSSSQRRARDEYQPLACPCSEAFSLTFPLITRKERVGDLELQAQLMEKLIPKFRDEHNREFYS